VKEDAEPAGIPEPQINRDDKLSLVILEPDFLDLNCGSTTLQLCEFVQRVIIIMGPSSWCCHERC
jgi:hypothetical protein